MPSIYIFKKSRPAPLLSFLIVDFSCDFFKQNRIPLRPSYRIFKALKIPPNRNTILLKEVIGKIHNSLKLSRLKNTFKPLKISQKYEYEPFRNVIYGLRAVMIWNQRKELYGRCIQLGIDFHKIWRRHLHLSYQIT